MPEYQTKIQQSLDCFRSHFKSFKSVQEKDSLVYIFDKYRDAKRESIEANFLIERLNLPLTVIHTGQTPFFTIKSDEYEL